MPIGLTQKRAQHRDRFATKSVALALAQKLSSARYVILPVNSRREIFYLRFMRPLMLRLLLSSTKHADPQVLSTRSRPSLNHEEVREILIIKCDHVGDFILFLPAAAILRKGFPTARITLLCGSWNKELALGSQLFDRVVCVDIFSEVSSAVAPEFDADALAKYHLPAFDIAVDFRVDPGTRFLLDHVSARLKAGFEDPLTDLPLMDFSLRAPASTLQGRPNFASHTQVLLAALADGLVRIFTAEQAALSALEPYFQGSSQALSRLGKGALVGINTGSGAPTKNWPLENFISVIRYLIDRHDATIALLGSTHQQRDGTLIMEALAPSSNKIVNLIGRTSLVALPQAIRQLDLYIGNDSGSTHLAAMLGQKTLCLHAGIGPLETFGPVGKNVVVLKCVGLSCSPCGLSNLAACAHGHRCMRAITPQIVIAEIETMLELNPRAGAVITPGCPHT